MIKLNIDYCILLRMCGLRYLIALLLMLPCFANAEPSKRQLGAHDHGYGKLNLAIEDQTVTVELETPAYNIVGFEHSPEGEKEKNIFKNAMSTLKNGSKLFLFSETAGCKLIDVKIDSAISGGEHSVAKEHDHGHKSSKHVSHTKGDIHSELHANYRFECNAIKKVKTLQVMLFRHFPNTRKLNVQIITPHNQSAKELTPSTTILSF